MPDLVDYRDDGPASGARRCPPRRSRGWSYTDLLDPQPDEGPTSGRLSSPPLAVATPATAAELMRKILAALASDPDDAIECIYTGVDSLLRAGLFIEVDKLLGAVEPAALPVVHLLAFVSITSAARASLSGRAAFVARVRQHLANIEPDRIEELLAGLE